MTYAVGDYVEFNTGLETGSGVVEVICEGEDGALLGLRVLNMEGITRKMLHNLEGKLESREGWWVFAECITKHTPYLPDISAEEML